MLDAKLAGLYKTIIVCMVVAFWTYCLANSEPQSIAITISLRHLI